MIFGGKSSMKKWNNAEIMELDINETANGLLSCDVEFWFIANDKCSKQNEPATPTVNPVPVTSDTPDTPVAERFS